VPTKVEDIENEEKGKKASLVSIIYNTETKDVHLSVN
jgi:hypothetical protein